MHKNQEKYNSIPFATFFAEKNGNQITVDHLNRVVKIQDKDNNITGLVYYSANIKHAVDSDELLGNISQKKDKVYYAYKNGTKGHDWLWHYGDLLALEELLNASS